MKATLFSSSISANLGNSGEAMVEIRSSNEEETNWPLQEVFTLQGAVAVDSIHTRAPHTQFYHVTVWWMTKYLAQHWQSIYVYNLWCAVPFCFFVK